MMLSSALLQPLLPDRLPSHLEARYRGGGFEVDLGHFAPADREALRQLYAYCGEVYAHRLTVRDRPTRDDEMRERLLAFARPPLAHLPGRLATSASHEAPSAAVRKAIHDLRGGALTAFSLHVQLLAAEDPAERDPSLVRTAAFLARDQAKLMRNLVPDLDPAGRAHDESEHPHGMEDVVAKWDGHRFPLPNGGEGRVAITCTYHGLLASCCLEVSAVDRLVFNYVDNAKRFTAGDSVRLEVYSVAPDRVRWAVLNPIDACQGRWLAERLGDDLRPLFRGGVTRGGRGLGLSNCADLVASAFGLPDAEAALAGGYLGATVKGDTFVAWAHWPAL